MHRPHSSNLQHIIVQCPQQIRPRYDADDLHVLDDRDTTLVVLDHRRFNLMKRRVQLCNIGVGLHDVTHCYFTQSVKQGFLNRLSTDKSGVMAFLVHNRKNIQSISCHLLSGLSHTGTDLDRFHRSSHDILSQQRRAVLCGQQPNDLLFDFHKCPAFDRGGCRHGVASTAKFSRDPTDINLRPAAPPDHLHPICHHHRHNDGIDSL